jgi:hypothetical protein
MVTYSTTSLTEWRQLSTCVRQSLLTLIEILGCNWACGNMLVTGSFSLSKRSTSNCSPRGVASRSRDTRPDINQADSVSQASRTCMPLNGAATGFGRWINLLSVLRTCMSTGGQVVIVNGILLTCCRTRTPTWLHSFVASRGKLSRGLLLGETLLRNVTLYKSYV